MSEVLELPETHATLRNSRSAPARPDFIRISNGVAGKKRNLRFAWNGQAAELIFSALDHALAPAWVTRLQVGGHEFVVNLHRLPDIAWMAPELAGVDVAALPEELACSVLQSCLADVATALARHGINLSVTAFGPFSHARAAEEFIEWSVSRGQESNWLRGTLSAEDSAWQHLASLLGKAPLALSAVPLEIPFPVTLSAGSLRCSTALLKGLELHDVVLADVRSYLSLRECGLYLRGRKIGTVAAAGTQITINQFNLNGTQNMADAAQEPLALDELEVELSFVVGQTNLSLGQLRALAPGAVFELNTPAGESVSIHANGRPIGKGELLEIGDRVGVRITELK